MPLVSIVVPVCNNAPSLADLLRQLQDLARRNPTDDIEFLFVDDGSSDASLRRLHELSRDEPRLRALKLSRNFGSGAAVLAGLSHARGAVVAVIAADLQDPPELIHDMLALWRRGRKVVLAARDGRDDPRTTTLPAHVFYALFRRFALRNMPSGGCDFFLVDRHVCDLITAMPEHHTFLMGQILWLGFDPAIVHYHRRHRAACYGRSMWTVGRKITHAVNAFAAFSAAPLHAILLLGLVVSAVGGIGFLGAAAARWGFACRIDLGILALAAAGWLGGLQLLGLGILGEYLWRTLDETRRRPRFVVDSIREQRHPSASEHAIKIDCDSGG